MRKKLYIIPILSIFVIYAIFNSYSHSFSSNNNNYSLSDATLYDKNTCFSPNDKLVDPNNNNWTHIFEIVKHSVVKVIVTNPYSNPEISTGFIYDNDGHIVTNYHVVNNANSINVTFADGSSYRAQISGTDPYSDLARKSLYIYIFSLHNWKVNPRVIALTYLFHICLHFNIGS